MRSMYHDLDPEAEDQDEAADSSPPNDEEPEAGGQSTEELERRNAELRAQLRAERADRLVERFQLPKPYRDLLKDVPRDRQEEAARKYAGELAQRYPATGTPDPDLDPVASAPSTATPPEESTPDPNAELHGKIREAHGWSDLAELQNTHPRSWEKDREATRGLTMPEEAKTAQSWDEFAATIDKARTEARERGRS